MSLASLENELVTLARIVSGNPKLTRKLLMEWRTGNAEECPIERHDDEDVYYIPTYTTWVAFARPKPRKPGTGLKKKEATE